MTKKAIELSLSYTHLKGLVINNLTINCASKRVYTNKLWAFNHMMDV